MGHRIRSPGIHMIPVARRQERCHRWTCIASSNCLHLKRTGANGPNVRWLAPAVAELPARVRAPSGPNFRVSHGVYPQRGTGVRVYRCVVCACVSPGRRVLGLPGSPSALSARSAWMPNWVLTWFPVLLGAFKKKHCIYCMDLCIHTAGRWISTGSKRFCLMYMLLWTFLS